MSANGKDLVREIGVEVVRKVIFDVLTGENIRNSTEVLTRRRLALLNLALVTLFVKGTSAHNDFIERLPYVATDLLSQKKLTKSERWLAQWMLGLTDKAFQNVLRDDLELLDSYRGRYIETCSEVIAKCLKEYGELEGELKLNSGFKCQVNWLFLLYLCNAVGAQTLAIRGSEKSAYGKLFEKLVLGSLLHILGFRYVTKDNLGELNRVFWLASRSERRESDATLLYEAGKGVRFDIGFIGRGNPEISLDKVTRFEREISLGRSKWYLATIIVVDKVGKNSRIQRLAKEVGGTIIQMSGGYWPIQVARVLKEVLGFEHELLDMDVSESEIDDFIERKLADVPLEIFIGLTRAELS